MKTMLLTGGSGFLGSRIIDYYSDRYAIHAPSHEQMDITDAGTVRRTVEALRPELIVHCAGVAEVITCEREPDRSWNINVQGGIHMAEAARAVGAKLLACSSDQVYCGSKVMTPHTEDEELSPNVTYGREKLAMEQGILEICPDAVLLRLAWMFDTKKRCPTERGTVYSGIMEYIRTGWPIAGRRFDTRGMSNVWDVVRNLEPAAQLPGGVYNFGATCNECTYDMFRQLFDGLEYRKLPHLIENRADFKKAPRNLGMDIGKIQAQGISFPTTLESLLIPMREELKNLYR